MKIFLAILGCAFMSSLAFASDGFEIIRDGQTYTCTPSEAQDPQVVAKCSQNLKHRFSDAVVAKICRGARSEHPEKCAMELKHILDDESVGVACAGAQSEHPHQCAKDLKHLVTDRLVARTCRGADSAKVAACAKDLKHRFPDEQIPGFCAKR